MIAADKRKAVFLLHQEGMEVREIARRLALSRNAVRTIIRQAGAQPQAGDRDRTLRSAEEGRESPAQEGRPTSPHVGAPAQLSLHPSGRALERPGAREFIGNSREPASPSSRRRGRGSERSWRSSGVRGSSVA